MGRLFSGESGLPACLVVGQVRAREAQQVLLQVRDQVAGLQVGLRRWQDPHACRQLEHQLPNHLFPRLQVQWRAGQDGPEETEGQGPGSNAADLREARLGLLAGDDEEQLDPVALPHGLLQLLAHAEAPHEHKHVPELHLQMAIVAQVRKQTQLLLAPLLLFAGALSLVLFPLLFLCGRVERGCLQDERDEPLELVMQEADHLVQHVVAQGWRVVAGGAIRD